MDALEAIRTRRSIRSFTDDPVSPEQVRAMLEAAMLAPSAGNAQPWRFTVIDDPQLLAKVPAINPYAKMAAKAPVAILVSGDTAAEKFPGYWPQDCAAAVENMLLAAHALGLGAVWTGIHPVEERVTAFQDLCSLPATHVPMALVVAGVPENPGKPADRYDEGKVRRNTWA
ncbi:nitroreductase family protein [Desulfohalovibrio reitneri]|uniref:nitroreductase family protein n=1 Tax=Desulfohalovibrio reitneri TaxID=1307759 RepID=UPI0004A72219|nr:nitroreductase family protein [Desulfohalovibrio reitneri]